MAETVDSFVAGFIGEPGKRTFYFQVTIAGVTTSYLAEKAQIAAFAIEAARLLAEQGLTGVGAQLELPELVDPIEVVFRVGDMQIRLDEDLSLAIVTLDPVDGDEPAVEASMTTAQLDAASRTGAISVGKGRPRCPRCSLAMDPDGHTCPVTNGDLRGHRP